MKQQRQTMNSEYSVYVYKIQYHKNMHFDYIIDNLYVLYILNTDYNNVFHFN